MKLNKANTQLGVTFNVAEFEDSDIVAMVADETKLTRVTDCVNADRRQKVALVAARQDLSEKIGLNDLDGKPVEGALGFQRKSKSVTKGTETANVWAETDNEHITRFLDALVAATFTTPGFTPPSGDDKVKETAAIAFLQTLANQCGDQTFNGAPAYVLDITAAVRKPGSGGLVAKWATEAAQNIIKNGTQATWATKFTNGYTSAAGITIDPIQFNDFQVVAPAGSAPEVSEATNQQNVKNLARAIAEARAQENAKTVKTEFA